MEDGIKALPRRLGMLSTDQVYFTKPAGASTTNAILNIGGGHWETPFVARSDDVAGLTLNFAAGAGAGNTVLGINSEPNFTGYLFAVANGGSFKYSIDFNGVVSQASDTFSPAISAIWGSFPSTSAALAAGGSLVSGTTYFYKVAAFDSRGNEFSIYSSEVSATPSGGNLSVTITWSYAANTIPGVSWFRVYRTTTSGNYTNANYYLVFFPTFSFTDTGQSASGTATPGGSTTGPAAYKFTNAITDTNRLAQVNLGSVNFGSSLNLGSGPFDGVTTGKFVGSANGTILAMNANTGFIGNLFDFQNFGVSKLSLDGLGNLTAAVSFLDGVGTNPISRLDCYYNFV